jgi:hypothetical protein
MRLAVRTALGLLTLALAACGGGDPPKTAQGSIGDVVVVLQGSDEPLPFDPRGGRITAVTQEIARLVGHPVILELDTALSPELKASLEETVLASFETFARELVLLQREDSAMFAQARKIERVVCKYDAVAKESSGVLEDDGRRLAVRAPPDGFPLLERWIVTSAVYDAHVEELEARWGEADPTGLPAREQAAWFDYMTRTRAGAGYLWIANRRKRPGAGSGDDLRVEHVGRIASLARVVEKGSKLEKKVNRFLLENATFLGSFQASPPGMFKAEPSIVRRVLDAYQAWLDRSVPSFDDEERRALARAVFERQGVCGHECSPEAVFPRFDRLAFGLSIYDAWVKDGAPIEGPPGPRGELFKSVVCPHKPRGEAETEIRYGCSQFFAATLRDDAERARLADVIAKRRDVRLLEVALLNLPYQGGPQVLALVESLKEDALARRGLSILFHDLARRDDVKSVLEKAAPRWWRDTPARRGFALLVMARQWEGLDVHYGDNQWTRFVAEFGGPIRSDVLTAYLAEGARAVEMTPKIWPALAKGRDRDELVAKSLALLLERDRVGRTSRARAPMLLLRTRYCSERDEAGFAAVRAAIERWAREHPDDAASVSNARADFTVSRCAKAPEPERD